MADTTVGDDFWIEQHERGDWFPVARARSLDAALLRARALYRATTVDQVRVVVELGDGRKRVYKVARVQEREPELPVAAVPAARHGSGGGGFGRAVLMATLLATLGALTALGAHLLTLIARLQV